MRMVCLPTCMHCARVSRLQTKDTALQGHFLKSDSQIQTKFIVLKYVISDKSLI